MDNKFKMTPEQNIFVAKRNIVDYIWKSANLEGIAVTYPETEAIFNGLALSNMKVDEVVAINNLKRAWQFVLEGFDLPTDYSFICQINRVVGGDNLIYEAGKLRNIPVRVGGLDNWTPDFPIESQIREGLEEINEIENFTDRAVTLMLYCMRKQMFLDGNKRTAMLAGNHVLIKNGGGIISVPLDKQPQFSQMLIEFYKSNDMSQLKGFIYDECIDGMDFKQ